MQVPKYLNDNTLYYKGLDKSVIKGENLKFSIDSLLSHRVKFVILMQGNNYSTETKNFIGNLFSGNISSITDIQDFRKISKDFMNGFNTLEIGNLLKFKVFRKAFELYDGREIETMIQDIKVYIIQKYYDLTIHILEKQGTHKKIIDSLFDGIEEVKQEINGKVHNLVVKKEA